VQLAQDAMRLRATDRAVYEQTKLTPFSVSTDKIGVVAMRCARRLSAHWRATATVPDRSGLGRVAEVYPAAALVQWGISKQSGVVDRGTYKGKTPGRSSQTH
jgi:hypothetical protein